MEILVILTFLILGGGLIYLLYKQLTISTKMGFMEGILLNAYKCSANISVYIEWDLLLQKYYPEKSRNEIFDIIDPFIRDRSSFLSIQSIRWIYENESIYNLPSITESVRRFYENSDSIWNEVSYFGMEYSGCLFGSGEIYEKNKKLVKMLLGNSKIPEDSYESRMRPMPFIISPNWIGFGFSNDKKQVDPSLIFWNVPIQGFIQLCVNERNNELHPENLIEKFKVEYPECSCDIQWFAGFGNVPNSFEFKNEFVRVSLTLDIARANNYI